MGNVEKHEKLEMKNITYFLCFDILRCWLDDKRIIIYFHDTLQEFVEIKRTGYFFHCRTTRKMLIMFYGEI